MPKIEFTKNVRCVVQFAGKNQNISHALPAILVMVSLFRMNLQRKSTIQLEGKFLTDFHSLNIGKCLVCGIVPEKMKIYDFVVCPQ